MFPSLDHLREDIYPVNMFPSLDHLREDIYPVNMFPSLDHLREDIYPVNMIIEVCVKYRIYFLAASTSFIIE